MASFNIHYANLFCLALALLDHFSGGKGKL